MFGDNKNFYPTPKKMIERMMKKVHGNPCRVLEPSAGKGDLIEGAKDFSTTVDLGKEYEDRRGWGRHHYHRPLERAEVFAIEKDPDLQATLRGKRYKVLDSDFLAYSGPDKFDLILMNPPFDNGDRHLLKAIEIMYRGQIVCLLNAETIRNPHTKTRKLLAKKLDEVGAEVKFYKNAFAVPEAERKTKVDVAMVYINIDRKVEEDIFADCDDHQARAHQKVKTPHEISTGKTVAELVAEYNQVVQLGQETIVNYFRNYPKVGKYIGLNQEAKDHEFSDDDLTTKMQNALNALLQQVRTDFWRRTLDLREVADRMTSKKQQEFEDQLSQRCHMDFTEANIRQFVLNLIGSYEQTMVEAVLEIFDLFTRHGYRGDSIYEENVHYFTGWKTNDSFKVGKKVIIPLYGGYRGGPFWCDIMNEWKLSYDDAQATLRDIETVMRYFDGMRRGWCSINQAIERAFRDGRNRKIESTYFTITCFKKGTIHLTFKDMDILRRFNVVACRGKGWLPEDYGAKTFAQLPAAEKKVAESFEGKTSYNKNRTDDLFPGVGIANGLPQLTAA